MGSSVKARIVKIGNSKGVRIPKAMLEQLGLGEEVELSVREDQLVIRPSRSPRADWDGKFELMAKRGDDRLLDDQVVSTSRWDAEEWEWE
jgi:antitoxin MazE